ncbi:MAG: ribosome maturation factor RimM [gamma proteobacterium symbiont of Bathyaustriella thionipta]|nr:ribosome maturation factor RimM [gamma proteobacterium symbiont of Bathyaustriella thionipta]
MTADDDALLTLGKITGVHGIKGWVKLFSETRPREGILDYSPLWLKTRQGWRAYERLQGRRQGKLIIAQLADCLTRDEAALLTGAEVAVKRSQLAATEADEYYWADLQGMQVCNLQQVALGEVLEIFETGANDVLVVKGERQRLIPFVQPDIICKVDLQSRTITVDWDADF